MDNENEDLSKPVTVDLDAAAVTDTPATTDAPAVKTAPEGEPESDLAKQFKAMQADRDSLKTRSDEANRRADAEAERRRLAEVETERLKGEVRDTSDVAITRSIEAKNSEINQAERELQDAMSIGDHAASAKAQRKLSTATAQLVRLEEHKADAEDRAGREQPRTTEGAVRQPQAQPQGDPVEAWISQNIRTPRSANWLREHKDCLTDRKLNLKMLAAHNEALSDDIRPDTDEYFAHIETKLGYRQADASQDEPIIVDTTPKAQQRQATIAAPVSRETSPNGQLKNGRKVTLTPDQREAARISGITEAEYAKQLVIAQNAGDFERMH